MTRFHSNVTSTTNACHLRGIEGGTYYPCGKGGRNGKADADSRIVHEPLTVTLSNHTLMVQRVLVLFLWRQNECKWGALDVDVYDLDHQTLRQKIQKLKLPLVHCGSKSGGAHLFLFLALRASFYCSGVSIGDGSCFGSQWL